MPILDITFSIPLSMALIWRMCICNRHVIGKLIAHTGNRVKREIGVDRFGTIAGKQAEIMDLAGFPLQLQDLIRSEAPRE